VEALGLGQELVSVRFTWNRSHSGVEGSCTSSEARDLDRHRQASGRVGGHLAAVPYAPHTSLAEGSVVCEMRIVYS
jgi:hypothetical protein